MATASTMVPMSLYQRTDGIYWKKKIWEKIYGFSYPKISFVGFINIRQIEPFISIYTNFPPIMYENKKFILFKFYNNGINYF